LSKLRSRFCPCLSNLYHIRHCEGQIFPLLILYVGDGSLSIITDGITRVHIIKLLQFESYCCMIYIKRSTNEKETK
jgi:hypothetical protein